MLDSLVNPTKFLVSYENSEEVIDGLYRIIIRTTSKRSQEYSESSIKKTLESLLMKNLWSFTNKLLILPLITIICLLLRNLSK